MKPINPSCYAFSFLGCGTFSRLFLGNKIKKGYEMQLFPREVDVTPTAAVLLGVSIPAQCEGALQ